MFLRTARQHGLEVANGAGSLQNQLFFAIFFTRNCAPTFLQHARRLLPVPVQQFPLSK